MKKRHLWLLAIATAAIVALVSACSSSSSNPTNSGGGNKIFDSGSIAPGGSFTHVFTTAQVIPYHCTFHGAAGGVGMSGTITVTGAGTPVLHNVSMTASNTFSPSALTIAVGDTVKWTNNGSVAHTATSDN